MGALFDLGSAIEEQSMTAMRFVSQEESRISGEINAAEGS